MPLLRLVQEHYTILRTCLGAITLLVGVLCVIISSIQVKVEIEVVLCFVLCILSMLVLSYQCLVPRCTRRMSNRAALSTCAALDGLFTVLWISAFAGMIAWIDKGMLSGSTSQTHATASCSNFVTGPVLSCRLGKTTSVFAALLSILSALAAYISICKVVHYSYGGELPSRLQIHDEMALVDQGGDAWSVVVVDDIQKRNRDRAGSREDNEQGRFTVMQSTETDEGRHPGRKITFSHSSQKNADYELDHTPSALSPMDRSFLTRFSRMGTFSRV